MTCNASVFIATSLDGFIARPDGELDWLPAMDPRNDMGYGDFVSTVDVLVMGRHTFEKVLSFGRWPYHMPVRVLSRSGVEIPAELENVALMSGSPRALLDALGTEGFQHAYIDGGETIQAFIADGLVQRLILTRIPVLIGDGLPLFGKLKANAGDQLWFHEKTFTWANGVVQSHYRFSQSG
ncbi:dihydrofolate reductase family protein [Simiduia agarivorans]|uniref:Riboflavin biosynthesis protein RibD domain-containing protein n=1 Tax=Simiduia agarivorans (strain DSM 21679 / JCM 13881 / BCRC 17597 / SA1) TaxID=1117647 RepID=K4KJU8_SIMAS|nr:dihydrofolate reductase family protein [Simiduia agarivorans]AFU98288.1 riboflavin biosynthesis protein RibD domain-containing protein [Simiduia agarivorans SA1 = DSM 21679]